MNGLTRTLIKMWQSKETKPGFDPEFIFCVGYSLNADGRLGRGANAIFKRAIALRKKYPDSILVFGIFEHSYDPEKEQAIKSYMFERAGYNDYIDIGLVGSTLTEAMVARKRMTYIGEPRSISIITGPSHSPTCYFVWKNIFPKSALNMELIDPEEETDPKDCMQYLRIPSVWLIVNVLRHGLFKLISGLFGFNALKSNMGWIRQPTAR